MAPAPDFEWHVLLDDNEWDRDVTAPIPSADNPLSFPQRTRRRIAWSVAGIVLCLALAVGLHLWRQAHVGLAAVEKSLSHTVALESQVMATGDDHLAAALIDPQAEVTWRARTEAELLQEAGEAEILDYSLRGDRAVARIQVTDPQNGRVYRESRFYRETAGGWLRTEPAASLWNSPQRVESEFFVFHFYQIDRAAVREAAPLLDAAYLHIHTALALPMRSARDATEKVQIHVASAEEATAYPWYDKGKPLWVDSPWLLRLPDHIADGQALAEMVAFTLRRSVVNELSSPLLEMDEPTAGLLVGLRLWLAWEETPVAQSHQIGIVEWLYENAPHSPQRLPVTPLERCEFFDIWQIISPAGPAFFYCGVEPTFLLPTYFKPPVSLAQLPISQPQYFSSVNGSGGLPGESGVHTQGQAIAFATLLEHAAHTYGSASVPALLQAAREGKNWATATPEIFGLSAAAFETGWRGWLAEKYGVDTRGF